MKYVYIYFNDLLIETLHRTEAEAEIIRKDKIAQGFDVVLVKST